MRPGRARSVVTVAGVLLGAVSGAPACFVDIDESLLDRDADSEASGKDVAASDAGDADTPPADAAVRSRGLLACGSGSCATPLVCCAGTDGNTNYEEGACFSEDDCPTGDFFRCLSAHDCAYPGSPGSLCCVVRLMEVDPAWTASVCGASCGDAGTLCNSGEPTTCPSGQTCGASTEFPALFDCKP